MFKINCKTCENNLDDGIHSGFLGERGVFSPSLCNDRGHPKFTVLPTFNLC